MNSPNKKAYNAQYRKEHTKSLSVDLPPELVDEFKALVKKNHDTIAGLVAQMMQDYIDDNQL